MNKVLITGASSGIGKELAHCFAKDQHHLIITARSEKELLALKEELEKKYSITVDLFPTDLSQIENVQKLTRWVAENGWSVTHLINNAGFGDVGLFEYTQWTKNQQMIELQN